jgi:heme a synthase
MPAAINRNARAIRIWLWAVAALVIALILVGGATRLTESGLSIVEWRPVTGVLPPLTDAAWQTEFQKYQTIPQYTQRNAGMSLVAFKTIYWWEWTHRLLGRLVGAAFLLPFLFFLWRGAIEPGLRARLWLIFGLGALQGAVGWWMVASGLAERTEVSQYRLATHLLLACLILAALVWTASRLARPAEPAPGRIRRTAIALVGLTLLQIYLGALVAGLRAGLIYNTWPLIDGAFVPDSARLWFEHPLWRNLFENALTVQFDHRMVGYLLCGLALLHALDARAAHAGSRSALALAAAVIIQALLGIVTLLNTAPIELALLHQAGAVAVLTIAVVHAARLRASAADLKFLHRLPQSCPGTSNRKAALES